MDKQDDPINQGPWRVAALYQFLPLSEPELLCERLLALGRRSGLCGTLIVAAEGINGTVAGSAAAVTELHAALLAEGFQDLEYKESVSEHKPFKRFKVRLKQEIVTLGVPVQPRQRVGRYIDAADWNALIGQPDVVLIDTRNRYEVKAGSFAQALNPQLDSFRQFPDWLEAHRAELEGKRIAMFCTGGIRCEKSTSLLLERGFQEVFHLKGGILKYLEEVPAEQSRWQGECFVFDERVTVGHGLVPGDTQMCHSCGWPLTSGEREDPHFELGVSCQHCFDQTSEEQKAAFRTRQRHFDQRLSAEC